MNNHFYLKNKELWEQKIEFHLKFLKLENANFCQKSIILG